MPTPRFLLVLLAGTALLVGGLSAGPLRSLLFHSNLHAVIDGRVYRSAQPNGGELGRWIDDLSLRTILNLRGARGKDDRRWLAEERAVAKERGIEHYSIRMSADDIPPPRTLRELVRVLDTAPRPLLLHCRAGAERSALAAAVAILLETGDLETARAEFALDKGFVELVNPRLPRVLDDYAQWLAEQGVASTPDRFRTWVANAYVPYFYLARLEAVDPPAVLAPGTPARLRFRITNASREPIPFRADPQRGVHLGARLHPPGGGQPTELRAGYVDLELAPDSTTELELPLPPLATPGRYRLEVDLVDENVEWFQQLGSEPLVVPLEVAAAS